MSISVTGLDRLRGDPYQFYASSILRLRSIDALDADPSAAWKGTAVHAILDAWHKAGEPPDGLHAIADEVLDTHERAPADAQPVAAAADGWAGLDRGRDIAPAQR